jgi:hypothetical protein
MSLEWSKRPPSWALQTFGRRFAYHLELWRLTNGK